MADKPHILIAGAGIGGLTAALALLKRGFDVDVYEQAAELRELGAGFQMSANGTRVLYALGLGEEIERIAWQPSGKVIRIWNTGQSWKLFDLGAESMERYGAPYLMFHRGDLHAVLADAVRAIKPDASHLNSSCGGCDQDGATVRLLIDGQDPVEGDALIGADGVHSNIRQSLFGADVRSFSGLIAWRGLVEIDDLPADVSRGQRRRPGQGGVARAGDTDLLLELLVAAQRFGLLRREASDLCLGHGPRLGRSANEAQLEDPDPTAEIVAAPE